MRRKIIYALLLTLALVIAVYSVGLADANVPNCTDTPQPPATETRLPPPTETSEATPTSPPETTITPQKPISEPTPTIEVDPTPTREKHPPKPTATWDCIKKYDEKYCLPITGGGTSSTADENSYRIMLSCIIVIGTMIVCLIFLLRKWRVESD
jgi:hypothetical protein